MATSAMTTEILLTLLILLAAVILFISERLRMDVVALLVMVSLAVTGLVTPAEALSGFASPAVVTVWAVFILSGGLALTGVASIVGRQILRLSGTGEVRLMVIIMLTSGLLSGFMNNVGVAALMLPVVLNIARQTQLRPSRLLMPLAAGCLLGGMTTLIGTPPNILASDALRDAGLEPFRMFSFTPVGLVALLGGTVFMVTVGRRLLPARHPAQALAEAAANGAGELDLFELDNHLAAIEIPLNSPLAGKSVEESRIGRVLGVTILGLERAGRRRRNVTPSTILEEGDRLLALGNLDRLEELRRGPLLVIQDGSGLLSHIVSPDTALAELTVAPNSALIGRTITELDLRHQYGFNVLAIRRMGFIYRQGLREIPLNEGDLLFVQGDKEALQAAADSPDIGEQLRILSPEMEPSAGFLLEERLLLMRIPAESVLAGHSLAESHLGDQFGLLVLGLLRDGSTMVVPPPETELQAGDRLLIEGSPSVLDIVRGLQTLVVHKSDDYNQNLLESEVIGLEEAVLSPFTTLAGRTLREIGFREKYGLSVLAIWRNGKAHTTHLGEMALQPGDAFLIYGPRNKIRLLSSEPDFLVLAKDLPEPPRREKALPALAIMTGVILTVVVGWLPIAIAAVAGAVLMVLTGCLSMEEAYRQINWQAVFLIAAMLPLGIALEDSGTAQFLAERVIGLVGGYGGLALLAGLFVLTTVASQVMPNAAVMVLMAPIALNTAADTGVSPYALMMGLAIAASASFMSPIGHPANSLVMGPGGYRFSDFVKIGIPMTLVVLLVTLVVLPLVWPLYP